MENLQEYMLDLGKRAKAASATLACAPSSLKDKTLASIADALEADADEIISANGKDLENARANGMSVSLQDRLMLNKDRIDGIAQAVRNIIALADPVGRVISGGRRPNGLSIERVAVPLGVIGVIYEARPNVTADAAALCLKSGNAVILRGGKEAINTNTAIADSMRNAVKAAGLPEDIILLVENTTRESSTILMRMNGYVDVLIPRGGKGLIKSTVENSTVPVIETGSGNCHVYVDSYANLDMAADIIYNAKTSRPSVCNACESLLIHRDIAEPALIKIKERLDEKNVEIIGDETVCAILPDATPATEDDWGTEYLDLKISVKIVSDIDEAIKHIAKYSTNHSECIVTDNVANAELFLNSVNSAAVYVNASTRFTDGGEFGFGAEIGISTQKLHARGPVGLPELTSYKYIIRGNGQVR